MRQEKGKKKKVPSMPNVPFPMPPIDHFPSRRDWEKACWKKLLTSPKTIDLLATPRERRDLVMRAAAVHRIHAGKGSRQIARELFLSRQTISTIRKALHDHAYRSYRERGKTERKRGAHGSRKYPTHRDLNKRPVHTKYGIVYVP